MKIKQAIARILAVTLTAMLVAPVSADAATLTGLQDTMSRHKVGTLSDHDIRFVNQTAINATGDTITVTFNNTGAGSTGWNLGTFALANFDLAVGDTAVCDTATYTDKTLATSAAAGTWGVAQASNVVTFTAPTDAGGTEIATNKCVKIEIGSNATSGAAGSTVVTNPSAASAATAFYEIALGGTNWGDSGEAEVPIIADDQIGVDATVDTYTAFSLTTQSGDADVTLNEITHASITNSNTLNDNIRAAVDTNADDGVTVQVKSQGDGTTAGLYSALSNDGSGYVLTSQDETLEINKTTKTQTAGYGLAAQAVTPDSGSLTKHANFDKSGDGVGDLTTSFQTVYSTTAAVVMSGTPVWANIYVLAVPAKDTPAADDYTDTLTFRATATF